MSILWEESKCCRLCWEKLLKMKINLKEFLEGDFIPKEARIICVAGGSGSGKSFISKQIAEKVGANVLVVDDYIIPREITSDSNWDLPQCWDLNLLNENLRNFLSGEKFEKPIYDFKKGIILEYEPFESSDRIVVEGLYALHDLIVPHADFSIFVESSEEVRLARVVKRDFLERKEYNEEKVTKRWKETTQPMFEEFVQLQREKADLIILN